NRQLRQAQDSLIRSEKLAGVGQLAAGVAHEVGNPLAALSGYLEILEDGDLDPATRRDILTRSQRQAERIRVILRNLLDYSREDASAGVEPVDLAACIDEALHLVRAQPKARGVQIVADLPDALDSPRAIASEVVQILVNLLLNAVDALKTSDAQTPKIELR